MIKTDTISEADRVAFRSAHMDQYPGSKVYTTTRGRSRVGRSSVDIVCPFCGQTVTAYIWSLAGGGKRCPCGAKHTYYGFTIPPASKPAKRGRK